MMINIPRLIFPQISSSESTGKGFFFVNIVLICVIPKYLNLSKFSRNALAVFVRRNVDLHSDAET